MNETKKAGVVTRLAETMMGVAILKDVEVAPGAIAPFMEKRADDLAELDYDRLRALDLVASWPPELREVVPLIEALPAKGKALLPDVLRGLSVKGMPALVEAQVGAVSTSAKVAAWFGGLPEDDLHLIKNALLRPGTDDESQAAQELGHQLRVILQEEQPLDANASRILASRMPRRQLKGTCPREVLPGQVRALDGTGWKVETIEGIKATIATETARTTVHLDNLRTWPLAQDFEPSDLAGLAKREAQPEPRVWKAGTVPPVLEVGMVFLHPGTGQRLKVTGVDLTGQMHLELPGGEGAGWWTMHDGWKLADDFSIPRGDA